MGQKQVLWTGLDLILIYQCFIALTPTNLNLCYGISLFHPLPASKKRSQFNWEAVQSPVNLQTKSKYKQSVANNIATKLYIYIFINLINTNVSFFMLLYVIEGCCQFMAKRCKEKEMLL